MKNVRYQNIDVSASVRQELRYQRQSDPSQLMSMIDDIYARSWNLVREWHMIQTINAVVNKMLGSGGGRVLVICGLFHLDAIKRHLPEHVTIDGDLFYTMAR